MNVLTDTPPSEVEFCGHIAPVNADWRTGVAACLADTSTPEGCTDLLGLLMGDGGDVELMPDHVYEHVEDAFAAAVAWLEGGFDVLAYGEESDADQEPRFDFAKDAGIVVADFQRLYGIDLMDPAQDMHWYRFCALLLSAVRTEGSLLGQAVAARGPLEGKGEERRYRRRLKEAWTWRMTDEERAELDRQRALAEFGGLYG